MAKKAEKVEPLEERIHINEYRASHPELSLEEIAGLTVRAGKTMMRRSQWDEVLAEYKGTDK
jgi:hypothetical protein